MNPPDHLYRGLPPSSETFDHCGNCIFFSTNAFTADEVMDDDMYGTCHRYPPSPNRFPKPGQLNLLLDVEAISWCGEHKRREPCGNSQPLAPKPPRTTPEKMMRIHEVEQVCGVKKSTIYKQIKDGTFPKPISISHRCKAWPESRIQEWIAGKINP